MLAKPIFRNLRKHWTGILLAFLAVSSTGYGVARWESSQTFNGLTIYCASSKIVRFPTSYPTLASGKFLVSVGFKNPNLFPVSVVWSASPILNGSSYFSGLLQDVVPGFSNHISTMSFDFIPPAPVIANDTLNQVVSYERYSILGDIFAEPRVFFISSDKAIPLGNNATYRLSNWMPIILWSIFIQHSNLLQSQEALCNPNDVA